MNKRIQKKRAKQAAEEAAEVLAEATEITGASIARGALELARTAATDVNEALRKGHPKQAMKIVRERAGEAIGQVTHQVQELIADTQKELKEKLADTEAQAEELLKKVPGVGQAAAQKLHDVTHR